MKDRSQWKMSDSKLQEHLLLKTRARRFKNKKREANVRACRKFKQGRELV